MDDELIVKLYWDQSENAISETNRKYGAYCHSISYNILQNSEDAEESVNDTYADVFSPLRNMLRPQLFINGFEAAMNLLTPTKPRCPHMGCALKWNPQEHSWDCPCHGSRFAKDGSLLDNPAIGNLKNR